MIINLVGPKEPNNNFKLKVASLLNTNIFQFKDLTEEIYNKTCEALTIKKYKKDYGTLSKKDLEQVELREALTKIHKSLYCDWLSNKLVEKVFRREENLARKLQAVVVDLETTYEYKYLRTYLVSAKTKKTNKVILIENDSLLDLKCNKEYKAYLDFEVDAVISKEDEDDLENVVTSLLRSWDLSCSGTYSDKYVQTI